MAGGLVVGQRVEGSAAPHRVDVYRPPGDVNLSDPASGGRKYSVAANCKWYTERQRDLQDGARIRANTQNHVQLVDEEQDGSNNERDP